MDDLKGKKVRFEQLPETGGRRQTSGFARDDPKGKKAMFEQVPDVEDNEGDEDDDEDRPRKTVLPLRKKAKKGEDTAMVDDEMVEGENEEGPIKSLDPRKAAMERKSMRKLKDDDEGLLPFDEIADAEEEYEGGGQEVDDDNEIPIEPFNLRQERKDGYFDADGNYVEYRLENDLKDAWLDSAQVDPTLAEKAERENAALASEREDLSRAEMAAIKRRIADALHEGETVLRALKRLGGHRPAKKPGQVKAGKGAKGGMAPEAVHGGLPGDSSEVDMDAFNRLTEDANALLVAGEYDVYSDTKESFEREASGYEAILAMNASKDRHGDVGGSSSTRTTTNRSSNPGASGINAGGVNGGLATMGNKGGATLAESLQQSSFEEDMFADEPAAAALIGGGGGGLAAGADARGNGGAGVAADAAGGAMKGAGNPLQEGSGYVYDDASGYYYNAESGYYYDSNSGLFYNSGSQAWYKYVQETGEYIPAA